MDIDSERIQELVERPKESLTVEIKRWIDPTELEGIIKIVKASLGIRNHGGGYIVIGFDNNTLSPDNENIPTNVNELFHIDRIQGLISKYASEPFEISIEFPERDGQQYPVIIIPTGVKTPVASKSDLCDSKGNKLIKKDTIYIRSLRANNTPSTTQANWKDWAQIVEVCFDNREADIGRFFRRHLGGLTPDAVREILAAISKGSEPVLTSEEISRTYLRDSEARFKSEISKRKLDLPEHGAWEVALVLMGEIPPYSANKDFLKLIDASNPNYTGHPVWLNSRQFAESETHPYVFNGVWEALIIRIDTGWWRDYIEFIRLDPKGRFYLRRALADDVSKSPQAPAPLSVLDFTLPVLRTAETLAVGLSFAKAMGCDPETTQLSFKFRWTGLRDRSLVSWADRRRDIISGRKAYQDEVYAFCNISLDTPFSALGDHVYRIVEPLFEIFDGFVLGKDVVEDLTQQLIKRRL